jgi:hypothetical protein
MNAGPVVLTIYSQPVPDIPRATCEATGCNRRAEHRTEFWYTDEHNASLLETTGECELLQAPEPLGLLCGRHLDAATR